MLQGVGIWLDYPAAASALETHGRNPYEAARDVVEQAGTRDEAAVRY